MKKLITLFIVLISLGMSAQNFSGKATYQVKKSFGTTSIKVEGDKNPELTKQLEEMMKKGVDQTFFLEFTQDESLYTEEEKLEQPTSGSVSFGSFSGGTAGKLYKNLKENYSFSENDFLGKTHLIKDTLYTSGWELSSESKQIGNYIAYKATRTIKPKNLLEDKEEEKSEEKSGKTTDLLSMIPEKDIVHTAWYTPEIPIPNGPEKFGGLPGLILELYTPNTVYLCSEIVLNPKKPIKIKALKGKTISKEEYDEMIKKRFESMPKSKDGGIIIQIGG